jgi:hypothetical protein
MGAGHKHSLCRTNMAHDDWNNVLSGHYYIDLADTGVQDVVKINGSGVFVGADSIFTTTNATTGAVHQAMYLGPSRFMQSGEESRVWTVDGQGGHYEVRNYRPVGWEGRA